MTRKERIEVRKQFKSVFSMLHNCALPKREGHLPKGTLCDNCTEYIDAIMSDLLEGVTE